MDIAFLLQVVCAFGLVAILLVGLTYVVRAAFARAADRLRESQARHGRRVDAGCAERHLARGQGRRAVLPLGRRIGRASPRSTTFPLDLAQHWLDEQKRTLGDQRDAVVKLVGRCGHPNETRVPLACGVMLVAPSSRPSARRMRRWRRARSRRRSRFRKSTSACPHRPNRPTSPCRCRSCCCSPC